MSFEAQGHDGGPVHVDNLSLIVLIHVHQSEKI
jgi:hypothetical protein